MLPLRVGNDIATINDVMSVIEILSTRREYTKLNPFVVLLGKGEHQITSDYWIGSYGEQMEYASMLGITRSNVTFLGVGKGITTILGGFGIGAGEWDGDWWLNHHQYLENITFKNMTVTNTSEHAHGIYNDECTS